MTNDSEAPERRLGPAWERFSRTYELLGNVFVFSLPEIVQPDSGAAPLLFLQVCRFWRDVALRTPQLWKSIHLEMSRRVLSPLIDGDSDASPFRRNSEQFATWLRRSGALPLNVYLNLYGSSKFLDLFYLTISNQVHRLRALELVGLRVCIPIITQGLLSGAPLLEDCRLKVSGVRNFDRPEENVLDFSRAPRLQTAHLLVQDNFHPIPILVIPNSIERIILQNCLLHTDNHGGRTTIDGLKFLHMRQIPPSQNLQILRFMPNIVDLHVSMVSNDELLSLEFTVPYNHIRFSHLTTLTINVITTPRHDSRSGNSSAQSLIQLLTLPSVRTLTVRSYGEIRLVPFLQRSKPYLTNLNLDKVRFTDDSFVDLLRELVFIEDLNIMCAGGEVRDRSLSFLTIRRDEASFGTFVVCPRLKKLRINDGRNLSYSHPGVEFSPGVIIDMIMSRNGNEFAGVDGKPLASKLVSCSLALKGKSRQVLEIRAHLEMKDILDEEFELELHY